MLYFCLKMIHIFGAAILLMAMAYCVHLWREIQFPQYSARLFERIQFFTWFVILPVALLLLLTGFTIISVQAEDYSQTWITASAIGFIVLMASWFSFIYFLVLSLQTTNQGQASAQLFAKFKFLRRTQFLSLSVCAAALLTMIFFMTNKIT